MSTSGPLFKAWSISSCGQGKLTKLWVMSRCMDDENSLEATEAEDEVFEDNNTADGTDTT
jgi:hypothetical protein